MLTAKPQKARNVKVLKSLPIKIDEKPLGPNLCDSTSDHKGKSSERLPKSVPPSSHYANWPRNDFNYM